jgi:hypothetical protein
LTISNTPASCFLKSVPDVAAKLKEPNANDEPFANGLKSAQDVALLVLVY